MDPKYIWLVAIGAAFVFLFMGYILGTENGRRQGYNDAAAQFRLAQEEATQKALAEAAKAANPFQTANPLEGVELNPFAQAKAALNPFR